MKRSPHATFPVGLLIGIHGMLAGLAFANPPLPGSAPVLTVRPAVQLLMPTEAGTVYQLETSPSLTSWVPVGGPVFGTGAPLIHTAPGHGQEFFRLQVLGQPLVGDALWDLKGQAFQLNDGVRNVRYSFTQTDSGSWKSGNTTRAFTWSWTREGLQSGRSELVFEDGSREEIQLQFTASLCGRFTRSQFSATRLVSTHDGSFGPVPVLPVPPPLAPLTLLGRPIALGDAPSGSSITLQSASGGTRVLDGQAQTFSGQWLVTGSGTARLTANFGTRHGEEYDFVFTGPSTGRFTRTTFTESMFPDLDTGTFCLGSAP